MKVGNRVQGTGYGVQGSGVRQGSGACPLSPIPCPLSHLVTIFRTAWNYLREVSGENDYARYRARARAEEGPAMTAEEFYLSHLRRKYSRINRCC
ncbi:MAG: CstA-like transporter-associated (seleno)protein [Terriglobia bacterium]